MKEGNNDSIGQLMTALINKRWYWCMNELIEFVS